MDHFLDPRIQFWLFNFDFENPHQIFENSAQIFETSAQIFEKLHQKHGRMFQIAINYTQYLNRIKCKGCQKKTSPREDIDTHHLGFQPFGLNTGEILYSTV